MLRIILITSFACLFLTSCASNAVYREFSEIHNDPIEKIKFAEALDAGSYNICVVGKLKKHGWGEYQIFVPKEHADNSAYRCRNDKATKVDGRYYCTDETIPIVNIQKEEIELGCQFQSKEGDSSVIARLTDKNGRTLVVKNSKEQDVAEFFVPEVIEDTSPMVYLFLPFTLAIDIVTFPIQAWAYLAMALGTR